MCWTSVCLAACYCPPSDLLQMALAAAYQRTAPGMFTSLPPFCLQVVSVIFGLLTTLIAPLCTATIVSLMALIQVGAGCRVHDMRHDG